MHRTRREIRSAARRVVRFYIHRPDVPDRGKIHELRNGWEVESDFPITRDSLEGRRQRYSKDEMRAVAVELASKFCSLEIPDKARVRNTAEGWEVECYVFVPTHRGGWFTPEENES